MQRGLPDFLEYSRVDVSGVVYEDIDVSVCVPCLFGFGVQSFLRFCNVELEDGGASGLEGRKSVASARGAAWAGRCYDFVALEWLGASML